MIQLYVASKSLTKENREICVRLTLPANEKEIWMALQKTEMPTVDDCDISDVVCDIKEVDDFLHSLALWKENIFELNQLAKYLSLLDQQGMDDFKKRLAQGKFQSIQSAIYEER